MAEDSEIDRQDAINYWGYLFQPDKTPTVKLDRLLRGIAICISRKFEPHDSLDLTPNQLSGFYHAVGGDWDPFFIDMPPASIAFIYKSLGCVHSLQPAHGDVESTGACYASPSIPALKPHGFVTWQTIQLLLDPEEHVPYLQNALRLFPVHNPEDGKNYPKTLPSSCLPAGSDPDMVQWHQTVAERLRIDAQEYMEAESKVVPESKRPVSGDPDSPSDERADAAQYFSNPSYKPRDGKQRIVRHLERPKAQLREGGKVVASTVKQIASPHLWSGGSPGGRSKSPPRHRKSFQDHFDDHHLGYGDDHASSGPHPHRARSHHGNLPPLRPAPSRRDTKSPSNSRGRTRSKASLSSVSSSDSLSPTDRRPRRHRSQEPPASPPSYFNSVPPPPPHSHLNPSSHSRPEYRHRRRSADGRATSHASVSGSRLSQVPSHSASGHMPRHSMPYRPTPPPNAHYATHAPRPSDYPQHVHFSDPATLSPQPQPMWPPPHAPIPPATGSFSAPAAGPAPVASNIPPGAPGAARGQMRPPMVNSQRYTTPLNGVGGRRYAKDPPYS